MTSIDKKIQHKSYGHKKFSDVRHAVNTFLDENQIAPSSLKRKGKKKYCTKLKGPHDFILKEEPRIVWKYSFSTYICSACNKLKIEFNR